MRFEFVLSFVMTGINLGVKYRLMLFSKYGFISRVLCARAFVYMLVGICSLCNKFALLCRLSFAQAICKAVGTVCINYDVSYCSSLLRVLYKAGNSLPSGGLPAFREGPCCIVSGFCTSITLVGAPLNETFLQSELTLKNRGYYGEADNGSSRRWFLDHPEDGGGNFLRNVRFCIPNHVTLCTKGPK